MNPIQRSVSVYKPQNFHPVEPPGLARPLANATHCIHLPIEADPKMQVEVDLPNQTVTNKATGRSEKFEINGYKKYCLMNALDDIDFLLENKGKIEDWERRNAC